jgi:hypothetical protein
LKRLVHRRVADPTDRLVLVGEAIDRVRGALRGGQPLLAALDRGFRSGLRMPSAAERWRRGVEPRVVEIAEGYLEPDEARLAADLALRRVLGRPERYRGEDFEEYVHGQLRFVIRDIVSRGPEKAAASVPR